MNSSSQRGFAAIFQLIILVLVLAAIILVVSQINQAQTLQSSADSGTKPSADACNARLKWENNITQSKFKNADFQGGYSGDGVPNSWTKFVISGSPNFGQETGYVPFGKSFRVSGSGPFSGGIYQTVSGLEAGKWYHAFYATAQKISGETAGANPTLRQIGVDLSGGTDPSKVTDWGIRSSGGAADKAAQKYGGWKVMGEKNNPLVTFQATGPTATIFIKVTAESPNSGSSDTWIVSAFLGQDCGSGETVNQSTNTVSSGGTTGTVNYTGNAAAACNLNNVKMSFSPATPTVGSTVTLNMTNTNGEGTTGINDQLVNLTNCQDNIGLGQKFDDPTMWPKVAKYKTCTVSGLPFKWTHQWKNCSPNDQSCNAGALSCSKYLDSAAGEQQSSASNSSNSGANSGSTGTTAVSDLAKALREEFNVEMTGFDNTRLKWAYESLSKSKNTKLPEILKGISNVKVTPKLPEDQSDAGTAIDCNSSRPIFINANKDERFFKFSLVHELGHKIYNCAKTNVNKIADFDNAFNSEGSITTYAYCIPPATGYAKSEDYADMLGYYIHSDYDQLLGIPNGCNVSGKPLADGKNPFKDVNRYPRHLAVVKGILAK